MPTGSYPGAKRASPKTLEALQGSSTTQALANATKHMDVMLHSIAHGGKTARTTSGYLRVAFWQAKPGCVCHTAACCSEDGQRAGHSESRAEELQGPAGK